MHFSEMIGNPFIAAVSGGQLAVIDYLLSEAEIQKKGSSRSFWSRMMHCAVTMGRRPIVDYLFASPWAPDLESDFPTHRDSFYRMIPDCCEGIPDPEVLGLLLSIWEKSAVIRSLDECHTKEFLQRQLYLNVNAGMHKTVTYLLDIGQGLGLGADYDIPELKFESYGCPIPVTTYARPLEILLNRLEYYSISCNGQRCNGLPYHCLDIEPVVRVLLEHGATPRNFEVVERAACLGRIGTMRALIEHGATVTVPSDYTRCMHAVPLAHAVMLEHTAMIELLLENGASFEQMHTITHIKFLSQQQPHRNALSDLIQAAKEEGLESMLTLMKEHGVDIN